MASKRQLRRWTQASSRANTTIPEDTGDWLDKVTDDELAEMWANGELRVVDDDEVSPEWREAVFSAFSTIEPKEL